MWYITSEEFYTQISSNRTKLGIITMLHFNYWMIWPNLSPYSLVLRGSWYNFKLNFIFISVSHIILCVLPTFRYYFTILSISISLITSTSIHCMACMLMWCIRPINFLKLPKGLVLYIIIEQCIFWNDGIDLDYPLWQLSFTAFIRAYILGW